MGGQSHALAALPSEKKQGPHFTGVGWASGLVWTGIENLAPTTVQIPNHPAQSELLFQLCYLDSL